MITLAGSIHKLLREAGKVCETRGGVATGGGEALIAEGKIMATNGLIDLVVTIEKKAGEPDDVVMEPFLLPAERIAGALKMLPDEASVAWSINKRRITMRCEEPRTEVSWMRKGTETYPMSEKGRMIKCGVIEADALLAAITFVEKAQKSKSEKICMTGQCWEVSNGMFVAVATDGTRMAKSWVKLLEKEKSGKCVVPGNSIRSIKERLSRCSGEVSIMIGKGQVMIGQEGWEIISGLIDEEFVNYGEVIRKNTEEAKTLFAVNKEIMERAIRLGDVATGAEIVNIHGDCREQKLKITATSPEIGQESYAEIPANVGSIGVKIEREPLKLNMKMLEEAIKSCESETVTFLVVEGVDTEKMVVNIVDDEKGWLYLLAPISKNKEKTKSYD